MKIVLSVLLLIAPRVLSAMDGAIGASEHSTKIDSCKILLPSELASLRSMLYFEKGHVMLQIAKGKKNKFTIDSQNIDRKIYGPCTSDGRLRGNLLSSFLAGKTVKVSEEPKESGVFRLQLVSREKSERKCSGLKSKTK